MTKETINWQEEVDKIKEELLMDLSRLLKIDSVRDDSAASEEFPVGPGPAQALNHFLSIAERDGFQTENFDNWAGHIEYGEGEECLGILAHVDVVPVGGGWQTDPFDSVIKDNRLYGRGASDDKGPAMAAYYAMKIVRSLDLELDKKIRFIIGTDEESDWQCIDHYFSKNPQPNFGFSPDASFPIINGEKGNVSLYLDFPTQSQNKQNLLKLINFSSGLRENMVPQDASAQLELNELNQVDDLDQAFHHYLNKHDLKGQSQWAENLWQVDLVGKASHGAHPENGRNAGTYLANFLTGLDIDSSASAYFNFISRYLHEDPFAEKVALRTNDDLMGDLTSNIGIMHFQAGVEAKIVVNFRYPKNIGPQDILEAYEKITSPDITVRKGDDKEPHYVAGDDPLVKTLLEVYERQTGLEGYEVIIGGGTYARTLKRGVAYGAMFPDSVDTMHQANEFIDLDDLWKATAIYAEAIYELCKAE